MKKYLIAITMMLVLGLNTQAASQKHRHSSRTEQVDSTKNNQDAIEAFSDTTSTADADDAEDDKYITHRHRSVVYGGNEDLKEVMDGLGGILAPTMIFSIIAMVILFVLAPLILIIAIFYFVNKNRKERYKLAQMAIQNGQPIPDDILKERTDSSLKSSDYQTGMKQMFTGIGLAIFLGLAAGKWGFGIGALVFFIGLGKWFIARQSGNTGDDPLNNNNLNNQFNNKSNVSDL
ncbi:MAG: hypothetical protein J6T44_07515 [Prevotella sp.]|nr:hypothetical protein [Prevotella sp.]